MHLIFGFWWSKVKVSQRSKNLFLAITLDRIEHERCHVVAFSTGYRRSRFGCLRSKIKVTKRSKKAVYPAGHRGGAGVIWNLLHMIKMWVKPMVKDQSQWQSNISFGHISRNLYHPCWLYIGCTCTTHVEFVALHATNSTKAHPATPISASLGTFRPTGNLEGPVKLTPSLNLFGLVEEVG